MLALAWGIHANCMQGSTQTSYGTTPVGYKGGSRYVDGFMVLGFLVLWFYDVWFYGCSLCNYVFMVLWFYSFVVSWFQKYQICISCFQVDIDPMSKIFKMMLDGSSTFFRRTSFPKMSTHCFKTISITFLICFRVI